jgi:hypothetical protein
LSKSHTDLLNKHFLPKTLICVEEAIGYELNNKFILKLVSLIFKLVRKRPSPIQATVSKEKHAYAGPDD